MSWWDSYRAGYRAELKASAIELAAHGWPVIPGTYRQGNRWTGEASDDQTRPIPIGSRIDSPSGFDRSDPAPIVEDWMSQATQDREKIEEWWSARPYSVLVATGSTVDVVEVSASVGRRVCALLREAKLVVPVAVTPAGRWWFAVRAGEVLRPELASRAEVVLHSRGSWVAMPPSEGALGAESWRTPPSACDWQLPDPHHLQVALLEVLVQRPVIASAATLGSTTLAPSTPVTGPIPVLSPSAGTAAASEPTTDSPKPDATPSPEVAHTPAPAPTPRPRPTPGPRPRASDLPRPDPAPGPGPEPATGTEPTPAPQPATDTATGTGTQPTPDTTPSPRPADASETPAPPKSQPSGSISPSRSGAATTSDSPPAPPILVTPVEAALSAVPSVSARGPAVTGPIDPVRPVETNPEVPRTSLRTTSTVAAKSQVAGKAAVPSEAPLPTKPAVPTA